MDLENKEKTEEPLKDEELDNVNGGFGNSKCYGYRCTRCNFTRPYLDDPVTCPMCRGPMVRV